MRASKIEEKTKQQNNPLFWRRQLLPPGPWRRGGDGMFSLRFDFFTKHEASLRDFVWGK